MDNVQILGIILAIFLGIVAFGLIIGAIVLGTKVADVYKDVFRNDKR